MSKGTRKAWLMGSAMPAYPVRFCDSTEGRRVLPDILQDAFGLKGITVVHRYNRALGAVIPYDAVRMLAGYPVDDETRIRVRNAALNALDERDRLGLSS